MADGEPETAYDMKIAVDQADPMESVQRKEARGNAGTEDSQNQNILLMWGCRPSKGVLSETAMAKNVVDTMLKRVNRIDLTVTIPLAFEQLKGDDASFEMVTSNTIQPMKLMYQHNIVVDKKAMVFVNTHSLGLEWDDAKQKGKNAK